MQVRMVAKEFSITPSLREYLERRLHSAFSPIHGRVVDIAVWMRDLNGPRGGRDMLCQVSVTVPGRPEVIIKEVQENMYNAIDLAVKRAAHRVVRMAARQRLAVRRAVRPLAGNEADGIDEVSGAYA